MVKTTNLGVGVMGASRARALYTSISRFAAKHRLVQSGGLRAGLVRLCILRSGETMSEANLVGGSQRDREQIWSEAPEALFFNLNGHTYRGREHWFRLWKFYGQNVASSYWTPFDIGGVVSDEVAVVWCHRRTKRKWTGAAPPPQDIHYGGEEFVTRSTMVFRKEAGDWRVVHAHFSQASSGERPGGV